MSIPPSVLESLQQYGDDPNFVSSHTDVVGSPMVEGSADKVPWRILEYDIDVKDLKLTGWAMLGLGVLMLCVAPLWAKPSPDERTLSSRLLFTYGPLISLTLAWGIYSLWLAFSPIRRGRVILESDRVAYRRSFGRPTREISYRQICWVSLSKKRHRVRIHYYPVDDAGKLVTTKLRGLTLPRTEDDEHLCVEAKQRAFGPLASLRARGYGLFSTGVSTVGWLIVITILVSAYAIFLQAVPWY
jgi:hypothetical protein